MKKIWTATLLVLGLALTLAAGPTLNVTSTYESGAVFTGDVTFTDDYSNVTAVDGWLVGGPYGSDHITWIWDPGVNYAAEYGPQYGGNFLMDGASGGGFWYFVTFTWDFSNAPNLAFATPGPILSPYGGNNINYVDPLVSGTIDPVPEPGSLGLLAAGLVGLGWIGRRRR